MKKHLIFIGILGSLLSCTGQPSGGDADSRFVQKYPYRFHTFTPHIYVDAFLNDSLPVKLVYDCAAPFVWLDSTFVDKVTKASRQWHLRESVRKGGIRWYILSRRGRNEKIASSHPRFSL